MQVLLLHPDAERRAHISDLLHGRGHRVSAFAEGDQALTFARHAPPPLVLAGGRVAETFISQLREPGQGRSTTILGLAETGLERRLLAAGADDVVPSGVPAETLVHRIGIAERLATCEGSASPLAAGTPLFEAVAQASAEFLSGDHFWPALERVLALLAETLDADDVYLFENHPHPETGKLVVSQRAGWMRAPASPGFTFEDMQNLEYEALGLAHWLDTFQQGRSYQARLHDAEPPQRGLMEAEGVRSYIVVPVFVEGALWGIVGIDDWHAERYWSFADEAALQSVALAIGRALERERNRVALERSERRYRRLVEQTSDAIYRLDARGRFVDIDAAGAAKLGYARDDVLGLNVKDILHPSSHEQAVNAWEQKRNGEAEITQHEVDVFHKDGSLVRHEIRARAVYEDGVFVGSEGVARDVTDQRQAEEALRRSEERYRNLLELTSDIVYRHDLEGRYTDVNESGAALLGYTRDEFLQLTVADLVDPSSMPLTTDMWHGKLAGELDQTRYEIAARRKDGALLQLEVHTRAVYERGELVAIEGVARNVTERRAAEAALRESEERNRALIQALPDFIFRLRSDGHVLDFHPGRDARRLTSAEQVIGQDIRDIAPPGATFIEDRMRLVDRAIRTGKVQEHNYTHVQGGTERHFESRIVAGGEDEAVVFVRDVTAARQAEEERARGAAQTAALYQLGTRLGRAEDFEEIYDATLEALMAVCETDRAAIRLTRPDDSMPFVARRGLSDTYQAIVETVSRWTPREHIGSANVLDDVAAYAYPAGRQEPMLHEGIRGFIGVRMVAPDTGDEVGQCSVYFAEPGQATPERVRLAETVASTAALAIRRLRAAAATRESEARFRTIFESAPEAMAIVRLSDHVFLDVNSHFEALSGYSADEITGCPWSELDVMAGREVADDVLPTLRGEPAGLAREIKHRHRDGSLRHCLATVRRVQLGGDDCALAIFRDITRRKQREEELTRLAAIVESTDAAIVSATPDGLILSANAATRTIYGYEPGELIGRPVRTLLPPENREIDRDIHLAALNGEWITRETVRVRADGTRIKVLLSMFPVHDADGNLLSYAAIARDITERKRQEEELARLALIVESAEDMIFATDAHGYIQFANEAVREVLGYAPEEMVGRPANIVYPPDSLDTGFALLREAIVEGRAAWSEADLLTKRGERRSISLSVFPTRGDDGAITGLACIARDITNRKRAEAERARLAAIVDFAEDAIIATDPDGTIISANAAVRSVYGYEPADIIGQPITTVQPADLREEAAATRREVIEEGRPVSLETRRYHADGHLIDVAVSLFPIRNAAGEVVGTGSISRDISERKRHEAEMARLSAVVQSSSDAIVTYDREGRIVTWNPGAEALFGYSADEAVGQPGQMLLTEWEAHLAPGVIEDHIFQGGTLGPRDAMRMTKDGYQVDVSVTTFPVRDGSGEIIGLASIARDISERKLYEAEMARLSSVVQSSSDAIITYDLDGLVHSWNAGAEALFGYTAEEMVGDSAVGLLPPAQRNEAPSMVFTDAVIGPRDVVRLHRQGTPIDVSATTFPIHDDEGQKVGVATIARDIREQKRAEREIRLLAAVVASSNAAIITYDLDGRVTSWNHGAEEVFGYTAEEMVGHSPLCLFPEEEREAARTSRHEQLLQGEPLIPRDTAWIRKDGTLIDVTVNTFPVRDAAGEVMGIATIARDITLRKQHEAQIALLAAVVESSDDAIYVVRDGKIIVWNQAAENLFGYTPEDARHFDIWQLVPDDDAELTRETLASTMEGVRTASRETVRLHRDGTRIEVSLSWFPVRNETGDVIGLGAIARDIREQRAAEAALREAQERIRAIARSAPLALFAVDADGILTFFDGSGVGLPKLDASPFVGQHVSALARVLPDIEDHARRALSGETFVSVDHVGGRVFETYHTPSWNDEGEVAGFFGVSVDVTERYQAEEARREAETLLRNVTDNMPMVMLAFDRDERYVLAEGGPLAQVGLSSEYLVGRSMGEVMGHDSDVTNCMRRALRGETAATPVEFNGHTFETSFIPWRDADGEVRGAIGACLDVTGQIEAERARLRAEALLQNIAANAPVGLVAFDAEGRIMLARGNAIETLGFDAESLTGQRTSDMDIPGGDIESLLDVAPGESKVIETKRHGRNYAVHLTAPEPSGNGPALVSVIVDITDRIQAEEALVQAQKLESLAVLAGGIAHDFNNLLVGILGNAGLALEELSPGSPARETIQDIEVAGRRAAELARQMLAYSGKGRFVVQPVDMSALVQEMNHLLRSYTHRATMRFELAGDLPPVDADTTQIRQVVMNLVINAADAIGEADGVIAVRTGLMHATEGYLASTYLHEGQRSGKYVYLEVADTGEGMTTETMSRIFDPFFTTKFTGKGLGLAAVLGIVRGHHGAIRVDSTPGEGTTFRLLLPIAADAGGGTDEAPVEAARWRGAGTVLVVDDEQSVRMVAERALRSFGFDVIAAGDGVEGLEQFEAHRESIVAALIDVTMPRMSGHALFERVRAIAPTLPVVFMSGFHEQDAVREASAAADPLFVQKPFDLATLRDAMQRALEGPKPA